MKIPPFIVGAALLASIPVNAVKMAINMVQAMIPGKQHTPVEEKERFFRYNMGLSSPAMMVAYQRLMKKPWSTHEWSNVASDYCRSDPQRASKLYSMLLVVMLAVGMII